MGKYAIYYKCNINGLLNSLPPDSCSKSTCLLEITILNQAAINVSEIATRITAGDSIAESELVNLYSRGLTLMLLKRTSNLQIAQDCAQETLLIALQKIRNNELRKPKSLAAFIRQTAINVERSYFRRERRYVYGHDEINSQLTTPFKQVEFVHDQISVKILLQEVIAKLPIDRDRRLLKEYYLNEKNKSELCAELGLSAEHFDRVLYRARQRLKKTLIEHENICSVLYESLVGDRVNCE